jgi:hypothetical protein
MVILIFCTMFLINDIIMFYCIQCIAFVHAITALLVYDTNNLFLHLLPRVYTLYGVLHSSFRTLHDDPMSDGLPRASTSSMC